MGKRLHGLKLAQFEIQDRAAVLGHLKTINRRERKGRRNVCSAPRPTSLLHLIEDGAHDSSDNAALDIFSSIFLRHVFGESMGQARDGQRLQPDSSGAGERGEKNSVAAENQVFDARDRRDLERNAGLKRSDVAGVDAESFAGLEVTDDELAESSSQAMPCPVTRWRRKPSPPKMPAPSDCWKPTPS